MPGFEQAFGEYEAQKKQEVMSATWGHLFPKKGKHRGYVIFAKTAYGQTELIDAVFEKTESSPWLYEALTDMITGEDFADLDDGVYVWRGYCYPESVLVREAIDEDDEDEYGEVVRLEGKIDGFKTIADILRGA